MITNEELAKLDVEDVKLRFDRGDWADPAEIQVVQRWLQEAEAEKRFIARCERATLTSALHTRRMALTSNIIAFVALVVAIIALWK